MQQSNSMTILGAGIMGLMTAYTLHRAGHSITVYDPAGFPADNASAMAGGMLAPWSEIEHMDERWVAAGLKGIEIWRALDLNTGFTDRGSLLIAHPDDRYILERFKAHLPPTLQTPQTVQDLEPAINEKFKTGLYLKDEAHLDPAVTMQALCAYLQEQDNVTLHTQKPSTDNRPPSTVIDCRGMAAQHADLRGVKGEILIVHNPEFTLQRPVRLMHPRYPLYIVPRENNHFMIGATVIESSDNDSVTLRSAMELMSALYTLSPSFADANIVSMKAGIRPAYPDNLPRITIKDNIISANGLFRHGYLLSPIIAQCIADHLAGRENEYMFLLNKGTEHENHNQRAA